MAGPRSSAAMRQRQPPVDDSSESSNITCRKLSNQQPPSLAFFPDIFRGLVIFATPFPVPIFIWLTAEPLQADTMPTTTSETLSLVDDRKVSVAPLVLLSVVDHFNRAASTSSKNKRVVGVLLGQNDGKVVRVSNSFAGILNSSPCRRKFSVVITY